MKTYLTIQHFQDRRGAASLRYRNCSKITVVVLTKALSGTVFVPAQGLSMQYSIVIRRVLWK